MTALRWIGRALAFMLISVPLAAMGAVCEALEPRRSPTMHCKVCGGDCGQCGGPVTDPSYVWDSWKGCYVRRWR